jgi:hypothetical protein
MVTPEYKAGLSIIIITKDTKELVKELLGSIEKDLSIKPSLNEIVLVDNGSKDGTDRLVRDSFAGVKYIRNDSNLGFARAANQGIDHCSSEFLLLLNSDTSLIEGEIKRMLEFMMKNKDVAIVGPQLCYPDLIAQRSFALVPSLLLEVLPRAIFEYALLRGKPSPSKKGTPHETRPYDVPSIIGAAMMLRREVIQALGGLDERFFFFLEETDLCVRAKEMGYRVVLYPETRVIHHQGGTVRKDWIKGRIEYNISLYKFINKHHNALYYMAFILVRLMKSIVTLLIYPLLPLLFFKERQRRQYILYLHLLLWHIKGCPDDAGLKGINH